MRYDLSIYIPTFNRARELSQLLAELSPQKQSCLNYKVEIVVSDNCSTDGTQRIARKALEAGQIENYIRHEINRGPDTNILECMKSTSGEFVWLLCDDDLPKPQAIEQLCAILSECRLNDIGLIYLNRSIERMSGEILKDRVTVCSTGIETDRGRLVLTPGVDLLTGSTLVFRRSEQHGRYTERFGHGNLIAPLTMALDAIDKSGAYLFSTPLVRYREGDKSSWIDEWPAIWHERVPTVLNVFCQEHSIARAFSVGQPWSISRNFKNWLKRARKKRADSKNSRAC